MHSEQLEEPTEEARNGGEPFTVAAREKPCRFTWRPIYTETIERIKDREQQAEFAFGIIGYGAYGAVPDFEYPLDAVFEGIKPYLDASKKKTRGGKLQAEAREAAEPTGDVRKERVHAGSRPEPTPGE